MAFDTTLQPDYKLLAHDFGETVTYGHKTATGSTSDSAARAVRLEISRREVQASDGFFTLQDAVWLLADSELDSDPKEGDSITDAGSVVWRVLEAHQEAAGTVWRCVCRRER